MAVKSQDGDIICGTEVQFLSADAEQYPQLTRLFVDFDYRIITVISNDELATAQYLIANNHYLEIDTIAITPFMPSLEALEYYTNENILEILNNALSEPPEAESNIDEL